jgi:hypothetical protein
MDRLEDFYDQMPKAYPKSEITNLVALRDTTVAYPWGGGGDSASYLVFPTEMKGQVLQIYHKDASATISFKDVSIEVPKWNSDKLDAPATNTKYDTYKELKTQYIKLKNGVEVSLLRGDGFPALTLLGAIFFSLRLLYHYHWSSVNKCCKA